MVNNYADGKRKPKNPDLFGPPVSYMEERGVLSHYPPQRILWGFYPMDPTIIPTLTALKPLAKVDHIRSLLILAKTQPRPYIIVVFTGGAITALGLLQELHTLSVLAHIPIYQPDETKDGHILLPVLCVYCPE